MASPPGRGQHQRELRALAIYALRHDVAAHASSKLSTDRQPKPSTLRGSRERLIALHERLEDALEQISADPATGVRHLDLDPSVARAALHVDPAAIGELHGIR